MADAGSTIVGLAGCDGWLALFALGDCLRPGIADVVAGLQRLSISISLVSGDGEKAVRHVANAVGITEFRANAAPDDKRAAIISRQRNGGVVAMIGDGVNDTPALAQADVSLSFGSAAALTQWTADLVAIGDDPQQIGAAIGTARKAFRIIRQNLCWAVLYNAIAIPLAATGHLAPLAAALGMSLSSLIVIANAQRLNNGWRAAAPARPAPQLPAPLAVH
jgi:Cu2+-exporting ATPase